MEGLQMPFTTIRRFAIRATAQVEFSDDLGGERLEVTATGHMTLEFDPTSDPDIMSVGLHDIALTFNPVSLLLPNLEEPLRVSKFRIHTDHFDLAAFEGQLNRRTRQVQLKLVFLLDEHAIPELSAIGLQHPIRATAVESGYIDIERGRLETHSEPFVLGPIATVYGGQFSDCGTDAQLCLSTAAGSLDPHFGHCPTEIWICPGEEAVLTWRYTSDAVEAYIDQNIGIVFPTSPGNRMVSPQADTQYTLTVKSECDTVTATARIHAVQAGQSRTLSASPDPSTGLWNLEVPVQIVSPNVLCTSIAVTSCFGGGIYPQWNCMKRDPDGQVRYFTAYLQPTTPGVFPLAGYWQFAPVPMAGYLVPKDNACFVATLRCR
jgi:hypothetical protein